MKHCRSIAKLLFVLALLSVAGCHDDTDPKLKALRKKLSSKSGMEAFVELHQSGVEGFNELAIALASSEVSYKKFLDWSYELSTRHEDGKELSEEFISHFFESATKNPEFAQKAAAFVATWPEDVRRNLAKDPRKGAQLVAEIAEKQLKRTKVPRTSESEGG